MAGKDFWLLMGDNVEKRKKWNQVIFGVLSNPLRSL